MYINPYRVGLITIPPIELPAAPLDTIPGAVLALSLRKLRTTYLGPAVRVQVGAVATDIGFNAQGGLDTVALLAAAGSGTARVTRWYNQGLGSFWVEDYTPASAPIIVNSGVLVTDDLGKPTIAFGGRVMYADNQPIFSLANQVNVGFISSGTGDVLLRSTEGYEPLVKATVSSTGTRGSVRVSLLDRVIQDTTNVSTTAHHYFKYNGLTGNIAAGTNLLFSDNEVALGTLEDAESNPIMIGGDTGFSGNLSEVIAYSTLVDSTALYANQRTAAGIV